MNFYLHSLRPHIFHLGTLTPFAIEREREREREKGREGEERERERERKRERARSDGRIRGEIAYYYAKAAGGVQHEMRCYFLREFCARTGIIL